MRSKMLMTVEFGAAIIIAMPLFTPLYAEDSPGMNPFFTAINYPLPKDMLMVAGLLDFQSARYTQNFLTGMGMVQYGITSRWTAGFMAEGQKIEGLPPTYGGERYNSYFRIFPNDHLLNFTIYGEYEHLTEASLYKMEVAGFGGEDLSGPLSVARHTPARTFEQRAIIYHNWGRLNATFNFISETDLNSSENDFGYAWGVFWQPEWMAMDADMGMAGMDSSTPPLFSLRRLGYGVEMLGSLGNNKQFGFYWQREQQYLGPVCTYDVSPRWSVHVGTAFGLSDVSDPFVLRMGLAYSFDHFLHR